LSVKFTNLSIICSNDREHANTGLLIISMVSMALERVNFSYSMFSSVNIERTEREHVEQEQKQSLGI